MTATRNQVPSTPYLCKWHITPQVITGYLLQFIRWKFSRLENIQDPMLRKEYYLWEPDDLEAQEIRSNILIATAHNYNTTNAQTRPAVIIKRQNTDLGGKMSIGERYQTPQNLLGNGHDPNFEATMGQHQQVVQISGSHSIMCIGDSGGNAEILGIELWQTFIDHIQIIRRDLGLNEFRVGPLQTAGKLKEANTSWVVPFSVTYTYQRSTLIRQEAPILKAFTVETNLPAI